MAVGRRPPASLGTALAVARETHCQGQCHHHHPHHPHPHHYHRHICPTKSAQDQLVHTGALPPHYRQGPCQSLSEVSLMIIMMMMMIIIMVMMFM